MCSQSFPMVGTLTIASLIGFIYLYQESTHILMPSRFWEMAAGCLIYIGFQKRASIEKFLGRVPPLFLTATSRCDVSSNVNGSNLHHRSGCIDIIAYRLTEQEINSTQYLCSPQSGLYRFDLLLALSMALGSTFNQSLDNWHPLVVSATPGFPNAWSSDCILSMD